MAAATAPTSPPASSVALARKGCTPRIDVDEFCSMIDRGVFKARRRIELWEGELVEKMPKNRPHEIAAGELTRLLMLQVPRGWHVEAESSVILDDDTMPIPDLIVARGQLRDYNPRRPTGRDVSLVVEVSDSSLSKDLGRMLAAYSASSIPIYWVVNLNARRVEVYSRPAVDAGRATYADRREYGPGEAVPVVLDGAEVGRLAVADILP